MKAAPTAITLLGSTGSIGSSTLDVIRRRPDLFGVHALAAGTRVDILADQAVEFQPDLIVTATSEARDQLAPRLRARGVRAELAWGPKALIEAARATEAPTVVSAIVGVAGIEATYEAARAGKRIALANKEALVAAGALMMEAVREGGAILIPVDSEHNGAHQCLLAGRLEEVSKLILTASGGPFLNTPLEDLEWVTPKEALRHPTWKMGRRITIDSATLMNKGFEVIEACWLFGLEARQVEVVIHPQSTVHAMVEYRDGSIVAQASATDMRMPIQYALTYPKREQSAVAALNWRESRKWDFHPPDARKFPLLQRAYDTISAGGAAGAVLNAADEIAVEAFLRGQIRFPRIAAVVEATLSGIAARQAGSIGDILEIDAEARALARKLAGRAAAVRVSC
ncbi:MAG: 1-deoxy-D-xylulose-5-phosphate reductoisomerase [Acidobacteria bacterium]|nr:1-deoxy-D-xylulose-5-phosphate reductoisomerase [Acidobacteriota bacterium]